MGLDHGVGQAGRDILDGGAGADQLFGGSGRALLAAGAGADRLTGGKGADIFLFAAADGRKLNRLSDFGGGDRIRIEGARWKELEISKVGNRKTSVETEDGLRLLLDEKRSKIDRSDFIFAEPDLLLG